MRIETQTKSRFPISFMKSLYITGLLSTITACSFIELQPGAENIIFAQQGSDCSLIETFTAEVKVSTLFIDRRPEAIAEELQTLAQNEAYKLFANAIWPSSDIESGKQNFEILKCEPQ